MISGDQVDGWRKMAMENTSLFQNTVNDLNEGILSFSLGYVPEVQVATKVALTLIPGFKK